MKKYTPISFNLLLLFFFLAGCKKPVDSTSNRKLVGGDGSLLDTNIKYFGRWDFSNSQKYMSYWGGAYIKVNFSGTTLKAKVGDTSNYYAKIDNGPWISFFDVFGTVNLTPSPLANTIHTLILAQGKDRDYVFNFQGLTLDANAVTQTPGTSNNLIEYIGDSITAGFTDLQADVSDYAWVCAESLGAEHTQIAYPSISLTDGYGANEVLYNGIHTSFGMATKYLKLQSPLYPYSPDWDFTKYTPNIIVINLGQNDYNTNESADVFLSNYILFLAAVRSRFPNVQIFAMRPFSGAFDSSVVAAIAARVAAGDANVHYVDTTGWLDNASDFNDALHPSVSGQIKAAGLLQPILSQYLK